MASSSCVSRAGRHLGAWPLVLALAAYAAASEPQDRAEVLRLAERRGLAPATIEPLFEEVERAAEAGLPRRPLVNKLKEGLAKGVAPPRVQAVLRDMAGHLRAAADLLGTIPDAAARTRAVEVLAEAIGRGVAPDEVREISRLAGTDAGGVPPESLAFAAKSWALMKETGVRPEDGLPLVAEAARKGYSGADWMSLAREVSRHRSELEAGAISVAALREAIRRGERPERLFPPRVERPERPAAERPARAERPERPARPEREPRERPERPPD